MRNRDLSRISEKLPINRSILSWIPGKSRFYRQKCGDFEDMGSHPESIVGDLCWNWRRTYNHSYYWPSFSKDISEFLRFPAFDTLFVSTLSYPFGEKENVPLLRKIENFSSHFAIVSTRRKKIVFLKIVMVWSMDHCYFCTHAKFAPFTRSRLISNRLYFFIHHFSVFQCLKQSFTHLQSITMSVSFSVSLAVVSMWSDSDREPQLHRSTFP